MRISDWSSDVCSSDLCQDDWYRAAARALGIGDEGTAFVFVCQEKTAPYVVTVARKSVVEGTRVSVRVDLGGRRILKKKKYEKQLPQRHKYYDNRNRKPKQTLKFIVRKNRKTNN